MGDGGEGAAAPRPDNLAYVLYTSGSTGRPKGVMIPHGALVNVLLSFLGRPGLTAADRVLAVTTLSFDISGMEIYPALLIGAHVMVAGEATVRDGRELARCIDDGRITWMQATPATWRLLLESGFSSRPGLKLLSGGEALPRDLASRLARCCDQLWNLYGPTETTIWSSVERVTPGDGPVMLGWPVANTRIHLMDADLRPVPRGSVGEVFIGGAGLARGYLNRPALTAERFLPDALAEEAGARVYRVGDVGRRRANGELEFLGRVDHQVKLRGFRIELGEIEAALGQCLGVRQAAVLLRDDRRAPGGALVAFIVPDVSPVLDAEAWGRSLREALRRSLPEPMLPARFHAVERMPLTPNGKVDRIALQRLEPAPSTQAPVDEPGGAGETAAAPGQEILAMIWCEVLGLETVGIHDDFFATGGHSLLAMQVLSRIRDLCRVELPVRTLFEAPTIAALARRLQEALGEGHATAIPPLTPRPGRWDEGALPASFAQQRLWFLDQLVPGNTFYNMPLIVRLRGELGVVPLAVALSEIERRHEVLRTTFTSRDGEAAQVIHPPGEPQLPLVDLQALDEAAAQAVARDLAEAEAARSFDLAAGPLWRRYVLRVRPDEHVLLANQHHIVSDGWSIGVFLRELAALYTAFLAGRPSPLSEPAVQYADFALWQRGWLRGEVLEGQIAFWRRQVGDSPPVLRLPTDRPRGEVQRFHGAVRRMDLPAGLTRELRALGRRQGATLAMTLLAGLYTLLHRITGDERISVGSPIAGRPAPELEGLMGFFVNTLVMVGDLAGEPAFLELLDRVRETALEAYAHQDVPFEKLVEELEPARDLSRNPLFQIAFALQNAPMESPEFPGLRLEPLKFEVHTTRFDLELQLWETADSLAGFVFYDTDLFDATTIERHLGHLGILLEGIAASPSSELGALPWLDPAERHQVLVEWAQTAGGPGRRAYVVDPGGEPMPIGVPGALLLGEEGLEARRTGEAARFLPDGRLEIVGRIDRQVLVRGVLVDPDTVEAALREHPAVREAVVTAETAGGEERLLAYVVPDLTQVAEEIAAVPGDDSVAEWQTVFNDFVYGDLEDGEAVFNLAGWKSSYTGEPLAAEAMREWLDDRVERILGLAPRRVLEIGCGTGLLLFAIASRCETYWGTDFSRASLDYVRRQLATPERRLPGVQLLERRAGDWTGLEPGSFDLVVLNSVVQYFPDLDDLLAVLEGAVATVAPGGALFLGDLRSLPLLAAFHASVELFRAEPPVSRQELGRRVRRAVSHEKELALDPALFPALRERLPRLSGVEVHLLRGRHANELNRFRYDVILHLDGAAPSEAPAVRWLDWGHEGLTLAALRERLEAEVPQAAGLLRVPNARLDEEAGLLSWLARPDVPGTVGDFLRLRRHATATTTPTAVEPDDLRDLAAELGYEAVISWSVANEGAPLGAYDVLLSRPGAISSVRPATLLPLSGSAGAPSPTHASQPFRARQAERLIPSLQEHLRQGLPEPLVPAAIPAAFVLLDELPRTRHGQVDRRALEGTMDGRRQGGQKGPRTPLEESLAAVWREVLDLPRLGIEDDFFALGGHSLLAMRVLSRVRDLYQVDLPVRDFFAASTIAGLARRVEGALAEGGTLAAAPPLVPLDRDTDRFPLSFAQQRLWFLDRLMAGGSAYNIPSAVRLTGPLSLPALAGALAALGQRHEALRTTFAQAAGEPVQVIHPASPSGPLLADLSGLPPTARENEARQQAAAVAARPFDLAAGPLWRTALLGLAPEGVSQKSGPPPRESSPPGPLSHLPPAQSPGEGEIRLGSGAFLPLSRRGEEGRWERGPGGEDSARESRTFETPSEEHVLLVNLHHVIADGWSMGVFYGELAALYAAALEGRPSPLPALPVQYADYAVWQRQCLAGEGLAAHLAFWRQRLGDGLPPLRLPADRPRAAVQSFRGGMLRLEVPSDLALSLRTLAQGQEATLAMTLLAAFYALLFRLTGQDTLVVGTPVAGRPDQRLEGLIGFFANSLVMIGDAAGDPPFRELLGRVRAMSLEVYAHQDLPFDKLVEELTPERDLASNPLFQVMFALQNAPGIRLALPGVTPEAFDYEARATRFDLEMHLWEGLAGLAGYCFYATDLFDATTVQRLAGSFQTLLRSLTAEPETRLSALAALSEAERHQLLIEWEEPPVQVLDTAGGLVPIGVWGDIWRTDTPAPVPSGERGRRTRDGGLERDLTTLRRLGPVDLWQVEEALLAAPQVEDCAVLVRTAAGEPCLVAYVVAAMPTTSERLARDLTTHCAARLPESAQPAAYVPVGALPLTPEGRLDREALLALEVLDTPQVESWESALAADPAVEHAAVLVREWAPPAPPPLHLLDLLPGRAPRRAVGDDGSEPAAGRRTPLAEEVPSLRPALADGGSLHIPEGAPRTLIEALLRTASERPDQGIVHVRPGSEEHFQSYPALLASARRVLTGLRQAGLGPGDRLILQVPDLASHFAGFWGAVLGGIAPVTVAVAPSYAERGAVVAKLHNTWKLLGRPPILTSAALRPDLAGLAGLLGEEEITVLAVEELEAHPPAAEVHASGEDDIVFLQLSSGSTGVPKCIQERHRSILAHVYGSQQYLGLTPDDVILNWLPMDHVVPTLTYHLKDVILGCRQIQIPTVQVLASPLLWLDLIEAHRVTHTWSPNFGFKLVSDQLAQAPHRSWDLSSLRFAMNAGEQVTMAVVREFLERVAPFGVAQGVMQPAYGMAEVCTAMTYCHDFTVGTGSRSFHKSSLRGLLEPAAGESGEAVVDFIDVGPPIPGVRVRIVDRDNRLLPEGAIGRLQIEGEVVTPGYLRNDEANREAFVGDGWFNTGDLGFLLDGRLSITGREKEIIIVRGANFYCYEVEDVVNGVEGVEPTFSGACGVADAATGTESLTVFFVPRGAVERLRITRETLDLVQRVRAAVTTSLGISPGLVVPMTAAEFPKTTSGKIQRVQLKTWLESGRFAAVLKELDLLEENANTLPAWFYRKVWRRREDAAERRDETGCTLVLAGTAEVGSRLCEALERRGALWARVEAGDRFERLAANHFRIGPTVPEQYGRLLAEVRAAVGEVERVVHLWTYGEVRMRGVLTPRPPLPSPTLLPPGEGEKNSSIDPISPSPGVWAGGRWERGPGGEDSARPRLESSDTLLDLEELRQDQTNGALSLLFLLQALERGSRPASGVGLLAVSSQSQPVLADDAPRPGRATLPPLVKTAPREMPWLSARHLDLPAEEPAADCDRILRELAVVAGEPEVAYRGGRRLVARLARVDAGASSPSVTFRQGGRYLLTGGTGGLGLEVARFLLESYGAKVLLTGRSMLTAETAETLRRLRELGDCDYAAVDVCDPAALEGAVQRAEERWGAPLDGALHLAGVYHEKLLAEETAESFAGVLRPKVEGGWALYELMRRRPGGLWLAFSSVNSFFGGFQVGAYAAANGFLDCLAQLPTTAGAPVCRSLAWSLWDELGISRGRAMQQPALARGFRAVTPEQGLGSLEVALGLAPPALLIGLAGERANVRRCLEPAGLQAQRAELFVSLRPQAQMPRAEMSDRFGAPVRGELRVLGEMPLLDGRVDRQQLALLGERFDDGPAAPRNDLERRLLAIWQEILDAPRLGVRDNFFRFGGHSLLAVRLLSKIQQELGFEAPLAALFTAPTVERMAELFGAAASGGPAPAWSAVVPIQPAGTRPPFFCVAPILGTVFPYYELARHLGPDQPFFGLQPPALSTDGPSLGRIEDLARFFVDALRTVQPHGPYHLGGWSFGTMVAHEMAHKLRQGGEEVALVALLDAPAPVRSQRLSATGTLRAFYDVVVRNLWPYVRDYLYLVTVAEGTNGHEGGNGNGNGHGGSRLRRLVGRLRSLDSLQGLVERAAIASVVPKESRLVMLHPPEIRGMLRALRENGRAMKSYKGSPYPGRVTVFRTENGWGSKDTALGWGELADAVDVRHIPGNHMTLLRSPHVEALAAALREALEEARP